MLAGLSALYLGERTLADLWRVGVAGVGTLLVLAALSCAVVRLLRTQGERRRAHAWVVLAYGVVVAALGVYAATLPQLGLATDGKIHTVLQVAWPALLLLGLLPAIAMELAIAAMVQTPTLEIWRVRLASRAARIVALAIIAFAGINFTAATWNRKIDLSYFKTTKVGTSTLAIAQNLTKPVHFVLFFPPGNEVLEQTRSYLDELAHASPQVQIEVLDQALEPERARTLKVRSNGFLAVQAGDNSEILRLDLDPEVARDTLRKLDAEVQQRLLKVIRPARVAYLTTGHMERDFAPPADDKRPGLLDFKMILEGQGFTIRRLGLGEGLGTQVPSDAALVAVMGPLEAFTAAERDTLGRYLEEGGRVFFALDPDHGVTDDALLAPLGLRVSKTLVANERYLVRVEGQGESLYNLVTTRTGSHPAVATLEQNAGRMGVVLLGTGHLSKTEQPPAGLTVTYLLHAMPQSWDDRNGNGKLDPASERYETFEFAAAVEKVRTAPSKPAEAADAKADGTSAAPAENAGVPPEKVADAGPSADKEKAAGAAKQGADKAAEPLRAVVVADADLAANGVVRNPGNAYFLVDSVRWLAGDEQNAGTIESEQDVPLVHRKDENAMWFYGTSFLFPVAVLIGGLAYTRRISRPRRR